LRGFCSAEAVAISYSLLEGFPFIWENKSMNKLYCVYIMTNQRNSVLYTGVTSDLAKRVYQHKNKLVDGFTKKYKICKLVYYECYDNVGTAIMREKQIKAGSRKKKIELINSMNPDWLDLSDEIL
jgi:putative endonuclease